MAIPDGTIGTLAYGAVTFDSLHKSKLSSKIVYDDAGRTVKWVEVTIEVEAYIDATDTQDLWQRLTAVGSVLSYSGKGFGDFVVNSSESPDAATNSRGLPIRDVNYGPKPEMMEFVPIGGVQQAFVRWRVTTCVPSFIDAVFKNRIFNLTYEVSYENDSDGYLTIGFSGSYEIPATWPTPNDVSASFARIEESADSFWSAVCPEVPTGFQRMTNSRRVSKDRRRVEFTVSDRELPTPLPPDCTMIEARHRVNNEPTRQGQVGQFVNWSCTISGTVRVNPRLPRARAWDRFFILLANRIKHARTFAVPPNQQSQPAIGNAVVNAAVGIAAAGANAALAGAGLAGLGPPGSTVSSILILNLSFEEDIFGKEARFSCSFRMIGSSLHNILQQSGLWTRLPDTDHAQWATSIFNVQRPHGNRNAKFLPGADVVVQLSGGLP